MYMWLNVWEFYVCKAWVYVWHGCTSLKNAVVCVGQQCFQVKMSLCLTLFTSLIIRRYFVLSGAIFDRVGRLWSWCCCCQCRWSSEQWSCSSSTSRSSARPSGEDAVPVVYKTQCCFIQRGAIALAGFVLRYSVLQVDAHRADNEPLLWHNATL
jgi:hypothetical protein